jgi:hypothetical protein
MEYPTAKNRLGLGFLIHRFNLPASIVGKTAIAFGLLVLLALMYPHGETVDLDYRVGGVWAQKDLIAPFSFPVLRDEKEYQREVETARRAVFQVFERDTLVPVKQVRILSEFFAKLSDAAAARRSIRKGSKVPADVADGDSLLFAQLEASLQVPLTPAQWVLLEQLSLRGEAAHMRDLLERACSTETRARLCRRKSLCERETPRC